MTINLSDNIKVSAPKPTDGRYLNIISSYSSVGEVNSIIPIGERHIGLTVNVLGVEYWYKNGILNTDLIEKKYDSTIPEGDFITGGTNIGFFSGFTGIQTLPITNLPDINYNGNYYSMHFQKYL